jgi:hypothetical protein
MSDMNIENVEEEQNKNIWEEQKIENVEEEKKIKVK